MYKYICITLCFFLYSCAIFLYSTKHFILVLFCTYNQGYHHSCFITFKCWWFFLVLLFFKETQIYFYKHCLNTNSFTIVALFEFYYFKSSPFYTIHWIPKTHHFVFKSHHFWWFSFFKISFKNVIHNAYPIHSVEKMACHQILIKVVYFIF